MLPMNGQTVSTLFAGLARRTWVVTLATIVTCVVFAASALGSIIEASYLAPEASAAKLPAARAPGPAEPAKPVAGRPDRTDRPDGRELVTRNMFCSSCTPAVDVADAATTDTYTPDAILIATSVGEDPRATVRVPATEVQGSYGLGETISGIGKVDRIGWRSIDVFDGHGRRGKLDLLDRLPVGDQHGAGGATGAATPVAAAEPEPFEGRVKKIDDHTFEVDRALIKEMVTGAVKPGTMRMLPISDKDGLKGLKLFGVKSTAIASKVGLQNGDMLTAINNNKITGAQSLLDVYTKIDTTNTLELDGTRGDKPLALTLRLK